MALPLWLILDFQNRRCSIQDFELSHYWSPPFRRHLQSRELVELAELDQESVLDYTPKLPTVKNWSTITTLKSWEAICPTWYYNWKSWGLMTSFTLTSWTHQPLKLWLLNYDEGELTELEEKMAEFPLER